jgi:predicted metal-dependent hydrolase
VADRTRSASSVGPGGVPTQNGRTAFADEDFQDYVVVRELLHLRFRTHEKRFQAMMAAIVPRWREMEGTPPESSSKE